MKDTLFTLLSLLFPPSDFWADIIPGTINFDSSVHDINSPIDGYSVQFTAKLRATDEIVFQRSHVVSTATHVELFSNIGVMSHRVTFIEDHAAAELLKLLALSIEL